MSQQSVVEANYHSCPRDPGDILMQCIFIREITVEVHNEEKNIWYLLIEFLASLRIFYTYHIYYIFYYISRNLGILVVNTWRHSRATSSVHQTRCNARDPTGVDHMQSKHINPCTISLAHRI